QEVDADRERQQSRDVEKDDAPREAREALGDEELPGARHPADDARKPARLNGWGLAADLARGLRAVLRTGRSPQLSPGDFCGWIEHVVCRVSSMPAASGHRRH